jgi:hypothetical protein
MCEQSVVGAHKTESKSQNLPEMHGAKPCGRCMFLQRISSCSNRKPVFVMAVQARQKDPYNITNRFAPI